MQRNGLDHASSVAEPRPTENDCRPRPELKVRSVGPVFPFLSATGCEHTRQNGIISKCNDLQAYCPGQHVRLGCGQVAFFCIVFASAGRLLCTRRRAGPKKRRKGPSPMRIEEMVTNARKGGS